MKAPVLVVKIGGSVVEDPALRDAFLQAFAQVPGRKILIHGGGILVTQLAGRLGIPTRLEDGRRITDAETLDLAVMVYAGLANKQLVASLSALGCLAIGMSGADADLLQTQKRQHPTIDFGFVGDHPVVQTEALTTLWNAGWTPVCCAITADKMGQLLNTNADTVASALAAALASTFTVRFAYLFDKFGVLNRIEQVIQEVGADEIPDLLANGTVHSGMLPKLKTAVEAAQAGASVRIAGVTDAAPLFTDWNVGTLIKAR